ncbi:hypothetical protein [Georgenia sp. AZ-5]|uniref:hypothetical protein n=1 Tax=Georgenia sp. AZ-5 TaxID=3367526 RepID=UPI0037545F79
MKQHAGLIWGLIGAAIAALGTIRTLMSISTGAEFTLQKAGFYVGAAAVVTYFGVVMAIMAGGILVLVGTLLLGEDRVEQYAMVPILVVAGAAGLGFAATLVFSDWLVYEDTDSFGRGAFALLGLAVIAGTIHMWRKHKNP